MDNVKSVAENYICDNCGGTIKYDIKSGKYTCSACGSEYEIETELSEVFERNIERFPIREAECVAFEDMIVVSCQNCGEEIVFQQHAVATVCPMCKSTQVAQIKQKASVPPDGIIPFKVDKEEAGEKFKGWIKKLWFAPNILKKTYQTGSFTATYIPFWTYDANVYIHYVGEGGENYQVEDDEGNTRTETRWYHTSGDIREDIDDLLICASQKKGADLINNVLPFNTIDNTIPYSPQYLAGFEAELYSINALSGFEIAKSKIESIARSAASKDILRTYDDARVHSVDLNYQNVTYKHVLLPIWSSTFYYKNKVYDFVINGESGKVYGTRPYSPIKIACACVLGVAAIVGIFYLCGAFE